MTAPANIRVNLNAPFPALVTGSGPVTVGKQNGIWTVGFNMAQLGIQNPPATTSLPTDFALVYDSIVGQFIDVPLGSILGSVLLNTLTANNSVSLSDTASIRTAYNDYMIVFENIVPATNNVHFELLVQSGGIFQVTGYLNNAGGITTYLDLNQGATLSNTAGIGFSGRVRIYNVNSITANKLVTIEATFNNGGAANAVAGGGWWNGGVTPVTGFQFVMSAGNISTGTIKIYGLL